MSIGNNCKEPRTARRAALAALLAVAAYAAPAAAQGVSFVEALGTPLTFPNGGGAIAVAQGDFNNDGVPDLAVTQQTNIADVGLRGFLSILLGNGDGTFQPSMDIALPTTPTVAFGYGIVSRDFNGDGNMDLVVASAELRQVLYFQGNGDGTFAAPTVITLTQRPVGLQVADLNGDGTLDLVSFNPPDNSVSVMLGNGDGTFASPVNYAVPANPQDIAIADVDGVNGPDIVVGTYDAQMITVLLNDGSGRFAGTPLSSNARGQVTGVYVADFDGDGQPDVVASIVAGPVFMSMVFMRGNGDGTFATPPDNAYLPLGADFPARGLGENLPLDLNGDGIPDVLFRGGTSDYVMVGFGNGTGGFSSVVNLVQSPGPGLDGTVASAFAVTDLNADGVLDIAVAAYNRDLPGGVSILLGTAPGNFPAPRSYQNGPGAGGLVSQGAVLADFRNTGNLDVAAVGTEGDPWLIHLLPGNGDGRLGTPIGSVPRAVSGTGEFFSVMKAADFNNDGQLDLIWHGSDGVQAGPPPRILIATGAGDGTFGIANVFGSSNPAWSPVNFTLADFNNDGLPDIAVWTTRGCGPCGAHIEVFSNDPASPGTFHLTAGFPQMDIGAAPPQAGQVLVAADFDGDGNADIVVPGANSMSGVGLKFFHGNGDGTFQPPTSVDINIPTPDDILAADLNGDGFSDLIEVGGNGVYIQLGNGDGTFQPPVFYAGGVASQSVAVADFNGDGIPDLGVGNGACCGGSSFSVLLGNGDGTFAPAVPFPSGSYAQWVSVGDMNGDGQPDVLLLHGGTTANWFTVLLNNSH